MEGNGGSVNDVFLSTSASAQILQTQGFPQIRKVTIMFEGATG